MTPWKRPYHLALRQCVKRSFLLWQWLGLHVTMNHYTEPIPDTRRIPDTLWTMRPELSGINMNDAQQLELLTTFAEQFRSEYDALPRQRPPNPHSYYIDNPMFGSVDGEVLYCMVRYVKPKRIYEVGSGQSTYLAAQAILRNRMEDPRYVGELVAIEPYPSPVLRRGFPGLTKVIAKEVQQVPLSDFSQLAENDILFIDSSHVLKIGSDVQREYLDILPRINRGVLCHIHDIFLPSEYPKPWIMREHRFWNEQYLLQAFLAFNNSFEVLWASSYLHLKHPERLEAAFSSYRRTTHWPGSFWIRRVA